MVEFIDWGNKQNIDVKQLKLIPDHLQYVEEQCE